MGQSRAMRCYVLRPGTALKIEVCARGRKDSQGYSACSWRRVQPAAPLVSQVKDYKAQGHEDPVAMFDLHRVCLRAAGTRKGNTKATRTPQALASALCRQYVLVAREIHHVNSKRLKKKQKQKTACLRSMSSRRAQ